MEIEKIDLKPIFEEQNTLKKAVADALKAVSTAEGILSKFHEDKSQEIRACLKRGASTGIPLQDEALACFGLNQEAVVHLKLFNAGFIVPGADLFMEFKSRKRVRFGQTFDERRDCINVSRYVLGTIKDDPGVRIRLKYEETDTFISMSLVLPFQKYVTWGDRIATGKDMALHEGEYDLGNGIMEEPNTTSFLNHILKNPSGTTVSIKTGEELSLLGTLARTDFKEALDLLHGRSVEEETLNPS